MPTWIQSVDGTGWCCNEAVTDVAVAIEQGSLLRVWWFAPWGERYTEDLLIKPDMIAYLRSESDDG